jgi:predicted sulfurtransferase
MLNKIALMLLVLMGLGVSGYSQKPAYYNDSLNSLYKHTVDLITAVELKALIEKDQKLVILDTREMEEFEVSHIEGARLIGYNDFDISSIEDVPKRSPIVLYCSLGVRSELVGEKL